LGRVGAGWGGFGWFWAGPPPPLAERVSSKGPRDAREEGKAEGDRPVDRRLGIRADRGAVRTDSPGEWCSKKGGGGGGGQVGRGSSWRGGGAWPVRTPHAPASRTPGPVRLLSMSGFCSLLRGAPPPTSAFACWGGRRRWNSSGVDEGRSASRRDCPALPTNTRMFSQSDCVILFGIFPGKPPLIWPVTIRKMPIHHHKTVASTRASTGIHWHLVPTCFLSLLVESLI